MIYTRPGKCRYGIPSHTVPLQALVSTITLSRTLISGNRYRIMVIVPGKRKFTLTLTVVSNYSIPQLQPANLPRARPKSPSNAFHDWEWGQGSSRTGLPCRTDLTISH